MYLKIIVVFLVLIACQESAIPQNKYTSIEYRFNGPVHIVTTLRYSSDSMFVANQPSGKDTIVFREDGSLKYKRVYNKFGELSREIKTEQNKNKRISKYSQNGRYQNAFGNTNHSKKQTEIFEYNNIENFIIQKSYKKDRITRSFITYFDSLENKIQKNQYNRSYKLTSVTTYCYGQNKLCLSSSTKYFDIGQNDQQLEYIYDSESRIEKVVYDSGYIFEYEYDQKGNKTLESEMIGGKITPYFRTEYEYFKDYYEKVVYRYSINNIESKSFCNKLDNNNNLLASISYNSDGSIRVEIKYTLDKYGNWVKKEIDRGSSLIQKRTIQYYDVKE